MFDCSCNSAGLLEGIHYVQQTLVTHVQDAKLVYVVVVLALQSHVPLCVCLDLKSVAGSFVSSSLGSYCMKKSFWSPFPGFRLSDSTYSLALCSVFSTGCFEWFQVICYHGGGNRCRKCVHKKALVGIFHSHLASPKNLSQPCLSSLCFV